MHSIGQIALVLVLVVILICRGESALYPPLDALVSNASCVQKVRSGALHVYS